ncbi:maestro heat-like repeat-containing protein family member 7 [Chelonia mydas]|uniref:maestro heat-like repeat-containing protein family member 7 n=1 Tax=Chelonia mydas TaxID=8469 RepID=UPI001CA92AB5|nr:maestro heat-like repeat-containing protein family member 7 [Chelonia mydas]
MAEEVRKVPLKPIRAWEKTRPPRRKSPRKRPQQQQELCVPQPFHADSPSPGNASCFMGPDSQEKETLEYINAFLKGNEQEEAKKLEFLDCVITISRAVLTRHPERNLAAFLGKALLVKKIKELIDLESVNSLTSGVRQQAMLAIMELSKVKPLLQGMELSSLLTVCFASTFSLPPANTNQGVEAALYNNTLNTMDELLKALVCEEEKPNLVVLQNILEVLLPWTASKEVHVRLRAVGRITWLTKFISGQHKFKGLEEFRVLGQLVGCLTLRCAEQEQEICRSAMEGLHHLYAFLLWQKRTTLAKQSAEYLQVFREWRAENTFWVTWFTNTSNIAMMFGKYFNPSERMDFLLTAIEGMKDTSVHDSVAARHMLHVILWVPSPSLERVSEAVMSIYHNLDFISEPLAQQQLLKALVVLGNQYSEEVVTTLLGCSLSCDSVAVEMWRVLTSHPKTAGKVLRELLDRLQEWPLRQHHDVSQQEAGVAPLAVSSSPCSKGRSAVFPLHGLRVSLSLPLGIAIGPKRESVTLVSAMVEAEHAETLSWCSGTALIEPQGEKGSQGQLVQPPAKMQDLLCLSQPRQMAPASFYKPPVGKIQRQQPVIVERLHEADRGVISNAITVLRDILAGMDRQSASTVAVQVAEKLLPFFHDEPSKLRVLSIALFKHLLELVRGPSRRKMKEHVLRSLVPLLLLLHDERPNVSQVCWDTLRSALEFLRWSQLGALVQRKELWRGCDCLVACYKGRAETFLCQAMAFLKNPQAPIREAAIRFLGLTARQLDQKSQEKLEAIFNGEWYPL